VGLVNPWNDGRLLLIFDQFEKFYTLFEEAIGKRELLNPLPRA
jgi:hypothetical protein